MLCLVIAVLRLVLLQILLSLEHLGVELRMLHLEKHELLLKVLLALAWLLSWLWRLQKAALLVKRRSLNWARGGFRVAERLTWRLRQFLWLLLLERSIWIRCDIEGGE
jgi:prephenate dehydrogenase